MLQRTFVSFAVLGLLSGALAPLQSQAARDRGLVEVPPSGSRAGFFVATGFGAGSEQNKFTGEPGYTDAVTKPTFMFRMGGTPNPNVRLGAEFFGWWNPVPEGTETFWTGLVTAQFYPAPSAGFYLKAGAGIAESGMNFDYYDNTSEIGFALNLGAGYDFPLSPSISMGPTIDIYQGSFTMRDQPTLSDRVINFGVQITFQAGR